MTTAPNIFDFNSAKRLDQLEAERRQVDAEDIRSRLHASPRAFIDWLFSGRAFCTRREARIGDVYGTAGASLSIALAGTDAGLWRDHATGDGGDLISLYMAHMGYEKGQNFQLALKEIAAEFFGDKITVDRAQWHKTARQRIDEKKQTLGTKPRSDLLELGAPVGSWKYFDTAGNVIASVVRYEPDGTTDSKTYRPYCYKTAEGVTKWVMGAPTLRPLYRIPEIALASTVVLVEGEKCADALAAQGIEATTAMQGAEAPVEKTDWSPLHKKTVIIWPDNDEPGFSYGRKVADHLAALGCDVRLVEPPKNKPAKWDAADCVAEGDDPRTYITAATPLKTAPKPRIRLLKISELESMAPPEWLIADVLTEHGLSMVWGRSGSLKSFTALDMGLCIATGLSWHGKAVKPGRVVYLAAEGSFGLAGRILGWMHNRNNGTLDTNFLLIPHGLTLVNSGDLEALISAVGTEPTAFIVIDTLSRTFGPGNLNQPADMNIYVSAADRLREATGAHVMVVHHGGKDTDKNELGNEGLRNSSDTVIHLKRHNDLVQLINEAPRGKQKDAEEFKTITLRPTKVAYPHRGTEKTTLILTLEDTPQSNDDTPQEAKLGAVERALMQALSQEKGLGLTRLQALTGKPKNTIFNSLNNLTSKNMIEKIRSEDDKRDEWRLK